MHEARVSITGNTNKERIVIMGGLTIGKGEFHFKEETNDVILPSVCLPVFYFGKARVRRVEMSQATSMPCVLSIIAKLPKVM
ncbi:hypothetical protein BK662_02425 [Pseudomonas frederiksbergensis]|uniref:Uncharacterized protein n=1 Tax=Pseudomonas frederiksbergensis TaxID=104087 RepID=A0A423I1Y5_9PSED|nr:hypothetical protein BK662_02425 [Pseudomonas frederiksbergensis]